MTRMPFYSSDGEKIIGRLSAYELSRIANHIKFFKPSLRYPNRVDRTKSTVLRALCDRYPNEWAGLPEIADKAKCSTAQARRALRELEFKDKLIVDVSSRLTWHRSTDGRWILESDDAGKKGGWGKKAPVQYFVCDRKLYDIYHHQQAQEKQSKVKKGKAHHGSTEPNHGMNAQSWEANHGSDTVREGNHGSTYAQSGEHESSITGASKQPTPPSPMIDEPIILNQSKEPVSLTTTRKAAEDDVGERAISKTGYGKASLNIARKEVDLSDAEVMGEFVLSAKTYARQAIDSTTAHQKGAVHYFRKYGRDVAIAAWIGFLWNLDRDRTWMLKEFIDSGDAELWAVEVQPYVRLGITSPVIIDGLLWVVGGNWADDFEKLCISAPELVNGAMTILQGFERRGYVGKGELKEEWEQFEKLDYPKDLHGFFSYLTDNPFRQQSVVAEPFDMLKMMGTWEPVPAKIDTSLERK